MNWRLLGGIDMNNSTVSISKEELKRMALVGGFDGTPDATPTSGLTFTCITAWVRVSLVSITSVSTVASLSTETFCTK